MPTYELLNLATALRAISRGVIMWHETEVDYVDTPSRWTPGNGPLTLAQAGDTEGPIATNFETERSNLEIPELTGSLPHESYVSGEVPTISANVWLPNPEIRRKWSPTNANHGGWRRRTKVRDRTLVIIPEDLFIADDGQNEVLFGWDGAEWVQGTEVDGGGLITDGTAIPAEKEHLIGNIVWLWRVAVDRPNVTLQHDEGSRNLEEVSVVPMFHPAMPNGHHVFTMGDPAEYGIDILGGS